MTTNKAQKIEPCYKQKMLHAFKIKKRWRKEINLLLLLTLCCCRLRQQTWWIIYGSCLP